MEILTQEEFEFFNEISKTFNLDQKTHDLALELIKFYLKKKKYIVN